MKHAIAILTAACAAQPALARPCTYPMTRLASMQTPANHPAPALPRTKESRKRPCTILQKGVTGKTDEMQALI